jgi:hypothetical protein
MDIIKKPAQAGFFISLKVDLNFLVNFTAFFNKLN